VQFGSLALRGVDAAVVQVIGVVLLTSWSSGWSYVAYHRESSSGLIRASSDSCARGDGQRQSVLASISPPPLMKTHLIHVQQIGAGFQRSLLWGDSLFLFSFSYFCLFSFLLFTYFLYFLVCLFPRRLNPATVQLRSPGDRRKLSQCSKMQTCHCARDKNCMVSCWKCTKNHRSALSVTCTMTRLYFTVQYNVDLH